MITGYPMHPARIMIFEDNNDLREGLCQLINCRDGYELAGAYINCDTVEKNVAGGKPDVILMDIEMPGTGGLEGIRRIRVKDQVVRILVLTVFDDNKNVFEAIRAGATGYLLKKTSPAGIFVAIDDAMNEGAPMSGSIAKMVLQMLGKAHPPADDQYKLTPREKEILGLLAEGKSYKMIAAGLGVGLETVKSHLKKVYEKLQVHSQSEAVSKAIRHRII